MLHRTIGEERFFRLLRTVLTKYNGKELDTDTFAKEASAIVGQDMSWFFKQWIEEPGIPDLDVSTTVAQEGGKTWLTGHLKQGDRRASSGCWFRSSTRTPAGPAVKLVFMERPDQEFRIELPPGVKSVTVDPARNNLVYYH